MNYQHAMKSKTMYTTKKIWREKRLRNAAKVIKTATKPRERKLIMHE